MLLAAYHLQRTGPAVPLQERTVREGQAHREKGLSRKDHTLREKRDFLCHPIPS